MGVQHDLTETQRCCTHRRLGRFTEGSLDWLYENYGAGRRRNKMRH
jgi:hypothetical protein